MVIEKGRKFKVNELENKESSGNNKEPKKSSEYYFQQKAKTSYCFQLLGLNYNWWWRTQRGILTRVAEAKSFQNVKSPLANLKLTICERFRCYFEALLLYGCETWTLMPAQKYKLKANEMWSMIRMLKIRRIDKISNDEVLRRAWKQRWIMKTIAKVEITFWACY